MTKSAKRTADLKRLLNERRRDMQNDVQSRIRGAPLPVGRRGEDDLDHSDGDVQGDLDLALLQKRAAVLTRIDEALVRLDAGKYGSCFECGDEIAERRLRAMPFAVRCRLCEEKREQEQGTRGNSSYDATARYSRKWSVPEGGSSVPRLARGALQQAIECPSVEPLPISPRCSGRKTEITGSQTKDRRRTKTHEGPRRMRRFQAGRTPARPA